MIKSISTVNNSAPAFKKEYKKSKTVNKPKEKTAKPFVDSFIKNTKKSAPFLLGLTGVWAVFDNLTRKVPLKDSIKSNLKGFFVPVLLASSALLSIVENNKKPEKKI